MLAHTTPQVYNVAKQGSNGRREPDMFSREENYRYAMARDEAKLIALTDSVLAREPRAAVMAALREHLVAMTEATEALDALLSGRGE